MPSTCAAQLSPARGPAPSHRRRGTRPLDALGQRQGTRTAPAALRASARPRRPARSAGTRPLDARRAAPGAHGRGDRARPTRAPAHALDLVEHLGEPGDTAAVIPSSPRPMMSAEQREHGRGESRAARPAPSARPGPCRAPGRTAAVMPAEQRQHGPLDALDHGRATFTSPGPSFSARKNRSVFASST
jgi:hypothetical protein